MEKEPQVSNRLASKTLEHGGLTTSYYDEGEGDVFVLVHGFTGGKVDFLEEVTLLAERFRVIAPDNRGHGESTNTGDADGYRIDQLVADLESFSSALALDHFHLLGHSLGGMVAMRYALAFPEKLASLVLMDTSSKPLERPAYWSTMLSIFETKGPDALAEMTKAGTTSSPEAMNGVRELGEDEYFSRASEKLRQMDLEAFRGLGDELFSQQDVTDELAAIGVPTTVMVGAADVPFLKASKAMAEQIPNAALEIIEDAAHCPQWENAKAWRGVIARHFERAAA